MKVSFLIIIILAMSITIPTSSFAQNPINCNFGDESTSLDDIFENDLAVKEFLKKYPDSTRLVVLDKTDPTSGNLKFTDKNDSETEILTIKFYQNENGCYRPSNYNYSYNNGIIDVSLTNSLGNFTEIINLIKSDEKKIEDFYPKNCNPIKLDYFMKGDSKPHFCKIDDSNSIVMSLQKHVGGPVEIKLPDKVMDALFYHCINSDDYFVLVNGEEVNFEWNDNKDEGWYSIIVDLPQGYSKVEMIRTFQLNLTQDGFCGSIWSEHERYLSPSLQKRIGVDPKMIRCNDNLVLIQKHDDSPACVKEQSITKMMERGWAKIGYFTETNDTENNILRYSPVLFKGTGVVLEKNEFTAKDFEKIQQRKADLERLLEDRSISERIRDDMKNEHSMIQYYSQQAFDEGVPFELVSVLWEKRMQVREFLSAYDREERFPIACSSGISVGFHAYSVDEKYVENPTALIISVPEEHFTKSNLQKADSIIREQIGGEIDVVYNKSDCYVIALNESSR